MNVQGLVRRILDGCFLCLSSMVVGCCCLTRTSREYSYRLTEDIYVNRVMDEKLRQALRVLWKVADLLNKQNPSTL